MDQLKKIFNKENFLRTLSGIFRKGAAEEIAIRK